MLTFFPTIYEDELLYSAISRYRERMGILSSQAFLKELYGQRLTTYSINFPLHIESLISNMPVESLISADAIIRKHTLYPFYTAFLNDERSKEIYNEMLNGKSTRIEAMAGILTSKIKFFTYLRYCPSCYREDIGRYGESFWRRLHQVPGVLICPKHLCPLIESNVLANNLRREFVSPNEINIVLGNAANTYSSLEIKYNLIYINNVRKLLDNDYPKRELSHFHNIYINQLVEHSYIKNDNAVQMKRVTEDFELYYSKKYLQYMQSIVDPTNEADWLRIHIRNTEKRKHPLRHLLLIQFLNMEIEEVFSEANVVPKKVKKIKYTSKTGSERYRIKWLAILKENPTLSRTQLKAIDNATYQWVVRFDRKWYEEVTPNIRRKYRKSKGEYSKEKDRQVLEEVIQAIIQLKNKQGKPCRITKSAIKRQAGITVKLEQHIYKETVAYINDHIEKLEEYRIRKIKWAINELLKEEKVISVYRVEQKAGFCRRKCKDIRQVVEKVLEEYEIR